MRRLLFSLIGVPMMFSAILGVLDVFPYGDMSFIANGEVVEITDEQKADIQEEFLKYIENAYDTPALGVIFPELYDKMIKDGYFLNFKFDGYYEFNGLGFNELTIKVEEDGYGFNVYRGIDGKFQGRCFYINTENSSESLYKVLDNIFSSINNEA